MKTLEKLKHQLNLTLSPVDYSKLAKGDQLSYILITLDRKNSESCDVHLAHLRVSDNTCGVPTLEAETVGCGARVRCENLAQIMRAVTAVCNFAHAARGIDIASYRINTVNNATDL
jgi:hypothetical protein